MLGKRWGLSLTVFLSSVSLASFTFVSDHPSHLSAVEGRHVYLPCKFDSRSKHKSYSWKINNVEYECSKNSTAGFEIKDKHGVSFLHFAARKNLDGATVSCVAQVNSKIYESNITVLRIVECATQLHPAHVIDSSSVELYWDSDCARPRPVTRLDIECTSAMEYRRVSFPGHLKSTKLTGLLAWTHFDVQVTAHDDSGRVWTSNSVHLMTRKEGVPPPPRFLTIERNNYHYEVYFSSCDEDSVLGYALEVSMDANFSSLVNNVTTMMNNMTRKLEVDGLADNTTYWMRMKAIGSGGESLYSAAQVVNTSAFPVEVLPVQKDSGKTVVEEMQSNGLLVATIILSILFVSSGIVVIYLCFYLRYHKKRENAEAEHKETEVKEDDNSCDKNKYSVSNPHQGYEPKTGLDSVSSETQMVHTANDSEKTRDVKVGGLLTKNGLVYRPNGYVNGTFYEL